MERLTMQIDYRPGRKAQYRAVDWVDRIERWFMTETEATQWLRDQAEDRGPHRCPSKKTCARYGTCPEHCTDAQ
jgi:hypothetical protein